MAGDIDVDGTANLDIVDIDGAVQIDNTFTSGVDGQGYDTKFFGDTSGAYILWDTSADKLLTAGGAVVDIVKDKLLIGGTAVTTTAAEINVLDGATAGASVASKAMVLDSGGDFEFQDNDTLYFGTGGDIRIFHDGSNSYIRDTGTGSLVVGSSLFHVMNSGLSENMIYAAEDSAVTLYYNNSAVFATTSTGAQVKGTTPPLTIGDGGDEDNGILFNGSTSPDYYIGYDAGNDALTIGTGTTIGGGVSMVFGGTESRVAIGNNSDAGQAINVTTSTGIHSDWNFGDIGNVTHQGLNMTTRATQTGASGSGAVRHLFQSGVRTGSDQNWTGTPGVAGVATYLFTESSSSGVVTDMRDIWVMTGAVGGATVTNKYGIYIEDQTIGSNDYGLYIAGADTYALWVAADTSRFDGQIMSTIGAGTSFTHYHTDDTTLRWSSGYDGGASASNGYFLWSNQTGDYLIHESDENLLLLHQGRGHVWIGPGGDGAAAFNNAGMNGAPGLTINQEGNSGEAIALKSNTVGHGITDWMETDNFAILNKASSTAGGLLLRGVKDADSGASGALFLQAFLAEAADTTDTTSSAGVIVLDSRVKDSGNSVEAVHADGNLLSISNAGTSRFLIKGDGDIHAANVSDGAGDMNATLLADNEDDVGLIRTWNRYTHNDLGVVMSKWDDMVKANEEDLRRIGVLTGDFYSIQKMTSLMGGAIWQSHTRQQDLQEEVRELKTRLLALEGAK